MFIRSQFQSKRVILLDVLQLHVSCAGVRVIVIYENTEILGGHGFCTDTLDIIYPEIEFKAIHSKD